MLPPRTLQVESQARWRTPSRERVSARDVSAVMVTYNSARFIEHGLGSLLKHAGRRLAEIIIVDNGSTDETPALVQEFARKTKHTACPVSLLVNPNNSGFGSGINAGVRLARPNSKYVLVLNHDIALHSAIIDEMCAVLDGDETIGLVGPRTQDSEEHGPPVPLINPFWREVNLAKITGGPAGRVPPGAHRESSFVIGCCSLARRSAFERAGGFDEDMFLYLEEPVISMRLRRIGQRTAYLWTSSVVSHIQMDTAALNSGGQARKTPNLKLYTASERHFVRHYLPRLRPAYDFLRATFIHRLWLRLLIAFW